MADMTRSTVSGATISGRFRTFETVPTETCARAATSLTLAEAMRLLPGRHASGGSLNRTNNAAPTADFESLLLRLDGRMRIPLWSVKRFKLTRKSPGLRRSQNTRRYLMFSRRTATRVAATLGGVALIGAALAG